MKYALIVAETNPLHKGHVYLIDQAKEKGYSIVVLMSGSFTQRGLPVVTDKFTRAKDLVASGADIVITLPVQIATSYGELFSYGSMALANRFKSIDAVFCGTEWGDTNYYEELYRYEFSPSFKDKLRHGLDLGLSYSHAQRLAFEGKNPEYKKLFQSNALLSYGYYKALRKLDSSICLVPVKRTNGYTKPLISATEIRRRFEDEPESVTPYCVGSLPQYRETELLEHLYILYRQAVVSKKLHLKDYDGYEKGIDDRLERGLRNCTKFKSFIENTKTRRYSRWRITRLLLHSLLGMDARIIKASIERQSGFQVLASNEYGHAFLKTMKDSPIALFSNFKHIKKLSDENQTFLSFEEKATNLWSILTETTMGRDFYGH